MRIIFICQNYKKNPIKKFSFRIKAPLPKTLIRSQSYEMESPGEFSFIVNIDMSPYMRTGIPFDLIYDV